MYYMDRLKILFIHFLCRLFIHDLNKREKVKFYSTNIYFSDIYNYFKFLNRKKIENHTVLLIEPNKCHGEVLTGFAKHFIDLGFSVDIIINKVVDNENPFYRFNNISIRKYSFGLLALFKLVKSNVIQLKKYDFVLFTSTIIYIPGMPISVLKNMDNLSTIPNLLLVEHDINDNIPNKEFYISNSRIITLGNFHNRIMVNPHYFGPIIKHSKNNKTVFIVIGEINMHRKNHSSLLNAIEELLNNGYDFEVHIIGKGKLYNTSESLRKTIKVLGRLKFPAMYDTIENADYLLFLLDSANNAHDRYRTSGVTGSSQLSYGFNIPGILEKKFADFYGFDDSNSIIYENTLYDGMKSAIELSGKNYDIMKHALSLKTQDIQKTSLDNLSKIISFNKGNYYES